jgi:2'-phosphotransferase
MSSDGYVPIQGLLESGHPRFKGVTLEDIQRVVAENDKQRFRICTKQVVVCEGKPGTRQKYTILMDDSIVGQEMLCVRANQGHSISTEISSDELLQRLNPEELASIDVIVHGTTLDAWEQHIRQQGLCRMKRNHIHFATGLPGDCSSVISGMRSSSQVYVYVDSRQCAADGIIFYKSDNSVLLTAGMDGYLPPRYFKKVVLARTLELLMQNNSSGS